MSNKRQETMDNAFGDGRRALSDEVPVGYKRTEVGVIPEDWRVEVISSVADVKTGPFGSALHERDYVEDGTPIITVEHLSEYGIIHHRLPLVSDADRSRLKSYALRAGDIVFSRVGSVDRNALVRKKEDSWLFSGRLLRVRALDSTTYPPYLSYHFHSEPFKRRVRGVAVGQTMASLNTHILKAVCVVLPTLPEQTAIAEALSDVDGLLAALEALIAKKRAVKQAAMQELLTGKTRLPGFSGTPSEGVPVGYKRTEVGMIPEDWDICALHDVIEKFVNGGTPSTSNTDFWSGDIPWITGADILNQTVAVIRRYITKEAVYNSSTNVITKGNLLIVSRTGLGKLAIAPCDIAISQDFTGLIHSKEKILAQYLFRHFDFCQQVLTKQNQGTSIKGITRDTLSTILIPLPCLHEQTAIASVLSDMDAEIAALEHRRDKTRAVKQGMMQQLLTGRVRLFNPE